MTESQSQNDATLAYARAYHLVYSQLEDADLPVLRDALVKFEADLIVARAADDGPVALAGFAAAIAAVNRLVYRKTHPPTKGTPQ